MKFLVSSKSSFICLAFVGLLQACGSSSSDTPPLEPVEFTFSLSSVLINNCGIEAPFVDIELLLQDSDWQPLEVYQADENGVITFSTFDENINYTLVAKNQVADDAEGLNIESYYQAKTTTATRYIAQFDQAMDQSSCQCITQDVELAHRTLSSRTTATSSLPFDSWEVISGGKTVYKNVEACRAVDGSWPLSSFAVIGTDVNEDTIGVATFSDNFDENTQQVWELSAFDDTQEITLTAGHQVFETAQVIQGHNHFPLSVGEDDVSLMLFNSHDYISEAMYHSKAELVLAESSSFFGAMVIESSHQKNSSIADESFSVMASMVTPDIDVVTFSEIKADGNYDYSSVTDYPMAIISFELTTYNPTTNILMPTKWTNYGPEKGLLAISAPLTGYEAIVDIDTARTVIDTVLLKSTSSNNYEDYIRYYQGTLAGDFVDDLQQYHIRITQ